MVRGRVILAGRCSTVGGGSVIAWAPVLVRSHRSRSDSGAADSFVASGAVGGFAAGLSTRRRAIGRTDDDEGWPRRCSGRRVISRSFAQTTSLCAVYLPSQFPRALCLSYHSMDVLHSLSRERLQSAPDVLRSRVEMRSSTSDRGRENNPLLQSREGMCV